MSSECSIDIVIMHPAFEMPTTLSLLPRYRRRRIFRHVGGPCFICTTAILALQPDGSTVQPFDGPTVAGWTGTFTRSRWYINARLNRHTAATAQRTVIGATATTESAVDHVIPSGTVFCSTVSSWFDRNVSSRLLTPSRISTLMRFSSSCQEAGSGG